jgi:hypothetical protein
MSRQYTLTEILKDGSQLHIRETWKGTFASTLTRTLEIEPKELFSKEVLRDFMRSSQFVKQLQKQVELALDNALSSEPTRGSVVYDELNKQMHLEEQFMHKVVAVDVKSEKLVAVGDTVEEAYEKARSKTKSRNLYFRRVGRDYLLRV